MTATERQLVPVVTDNVAALAALATQLDAIAALAEITRSQVGFLPSAEHYPIVDFAVRAWAARCGAAIAESEPRIHPELPLIVDVYRVMLGGREIVTVHRPQELCERPYQPPRVEIDRNAMWSPSDGAL